MTTTAVNTAELLRVEGLAAGYRGHTIVDDLSFNVAAGTVSLFIGANGAGKSTLSKALVGLAEVHRGAIILEGKHIESLPASRRIGGGLGYVPQDPVLFPSFRVERCLHLTLRGLPRRVREQRLSVVYDLLPDIARMRHVRAGLLSGGQLRLLGFAVALCGEPALLVVDEPSAGVAPALASTLLGTLRDLAVSRSIGVVLIEQNVRAGLVVADTVHVLRRGRLAATFTPDELMARENLWDLL